MITHHQLSGTQLRELIRRKAIGGNRKLEIYGSLNCSSGKRMKTENRVFFVSEQEAIEQGYRPCGNCLNHKYKKWRNGSF